MKTVKTRVHPQALESLKRYKGDVKAGHKDAAEYWRGQAGAYFTANPRYMCPLCGKVFKTEGTYRRHATKFCKGKSSRKRNPVLESLVSGAAIGIGFAAGGKIMDKIAKNPKRKPKTRRKAKR